MSDKHPGGAPTKYNKQLHPILARSLAQLGKTDKEMAVILEISESTFYLWRKTHKEFLQSLSEGKGSIDEQVQNALLKRALGYEEEDEKVFQYLGQIITHTGTKIYPPDVTAAFRWLCNRMPKEWADRKIVGGDKENPIVHDASDEIKALIKKISR